MAAGNMVAIIEIGKVAGHRCYGMVPVQGMVEPFPRSRNDVVKMVVTMMRDDDDSSSSSFFTHDDSVFIIFQS